ncbi:hypothetical protein [Horticoccus sp. 23ND18S-11]
MWVLPQIAPEFFARNAIDGSSTRALWLQVMACVHVGLGAGYLVQLGLLPWLGGIFSRAAAAQPALATVRTRTAGAAVPSFGTFPGSLVAARHQGGMAALRRWPATLRRASAEGRGRMVLTLQGARQWPRRLAAGGEVLTPEPQLVRASSMA